MFPTPFDDIKYPVPGVVTTPCQPLVVGKPTTVSTGLYSKSNDFMPRFSPANNAYMGNTMSTWKEYTVYDLYAESLSDRYNN